MSTLVRLVEAYFAWRFRRDCTPVEALRLISQAPVIRRSEE